MKIGFIGLGKMGGPMAMNLLCSGHEVTVYDIKKEAAQPLVDANGRWADSPKEVAQVSEIVLTSLPGPPEVEVVVLSENGIMAGAKNGSILIDFSTNSPSTAVISLKRPPVPPLGNGMKKPGKPSWPCWKKTASVGNAVISKDALEAALRPITWMRRLACTG